MRTGGRDLSTSYDGREHIRDKEDKMYARLRDGPAQVHTKYHGYIKLAVGVPHPSWQPDHLDDEQYNTIILVDGGAYLVQSIDFDFDENFVPSCPSCGNALESVKVFAASTWVLDKDKYVEDRRLGDLISICPQCGNTLPREIFPEGPANY